MLTQIDRQILRSWREHLVGPRLAALTGKTSSRKTGPRIAVVGNCQSFGVAYAMHLLNPWANVNRFATHLKSHLSVDILAKTLATYDYVFAHEFQGGLIKGGDSTDLGRLLPKTIFFPALAFPAFHPDHVYLLDPTRNDAAITGPFGVNHSALALFAFRKGLPIEEALALFNANVFEELGYFDTWNPAVAQMLDHAARFSLDLSADVIRWSRRGVFMWTHIHPKSYVLADLARHLLTRSGIAFADTDIDNYDVDDLGRGEVFPVYPPIAERYGCRGAYLFKLRNYQLSSSVGDCLTLREFVSASYKAYGRYAPAQLSNARVDGWLADKATTGVLAALAKDNFRAGLTPQ